MGVAIIGELFPTWAQYSFHNSISINRAITSNLGLSEYLFFQPCLFGYQIGATVV
jgi:hypothetical protein